MDAGARIGSYEIVAKVGEGGMGEVYRASDTKLKRQVALKILPATVAGDPERLARFRREAELLAALNHPHIAGIYGFEDSGDTHALVMELVDGDDLAQRIARGPIPLDEALPIAKQIAEALEAAHEQGIVHRDLKPANIKVRPDGTVKVLDFGLAKALEAQAGAGVPGAGGLGAAQLTNSPTLTSPVFSQVGMILGTAAYMAPEQAKGRAVDRRADIWAFGAVLYEMLTGKQAFEGEDVTDLIVSVMSKEPDWSALPATAPGPIRKLLRRCLERDPRRRLQAIADARLEIDDALAGEAETGAMVRPPPQARAQSKVAWSATTVLAVALAALAFIHLRETSPGRRRLRLSVPLQGNVAPRRFALSPDGRSVVIQYPASGLIVRSLESGDIRTLTGTELARAPFWSPDSRMIGFLASDNKLKIVAASGGVPQTLCDTSGASATWNRAGTIFVGSGTLVHVSGSSSTCTEIVKARPGPAPYDQPVFLPDGKHFLYVDRTSTDETRRGLFVASLDNPAGRRLLGDNSSALFVPNTPGATQGRLLFLREQTLMAQPFDAVSLQLSGEPAIVANHIGFQGDGNIAASVADDGTLMYLANGRPDRQLVWFDRTGAEVGRAAVTGSSGVSNMSLSPDGRRVAFIRVDGPPTLWIEDLDRHQELKLTSPPVIVGGGPGRGGLVWPPGGERIGFSATGAKDGNGLYVKNVNGSAEELVIKSETNLLASDWSRDGHWLVYTANDPKTGADIWVVRDPSSPAASGKPMPLVSTSATDSQGQLSPDGKWLAYYSDESGTGAVYLRPFNGGGVGEMKWMLSTGPGYAAEPRWRSDSHELFYLEPVAGAPRLKVMAVSIGSGPSPASTPKPLFEFSSGLIVPASNAFAYSPAPDGQRFLVNAYASDLQPTLEVILNWAGGAK